MYIYSKLTQNRCTHVAIKTYCVTNSTLQLMKLPDIDEVKAFDTDWTGTRMMMTIPPWIRYFITTGATIGLGNALMKLYNSWLTNDLIDIEQMYHVTGAFDDFDLGRV